MVYEESLRSITLDADATLAVFTGPPGVTGSANADAIGGNQYKAVFITGKHQAGLANAVTSKIDGVLQNKPQHTGDAATIGFHGVTRLKVSTNINAGDTVYLAADGTGCNASANSASVIGKALDTTTTAGAIIPVLLKLGN